MDKVPGFKCGINAPIYRCLFQDTRKNQSLFPSYLGNAAAGLRRDKTNTDWG